jgi:hypothetical protein
MEKLRGHVILIVETEIGPFIRNLQAALEAAGAEALVARDAAVALRRAQQFAGGQLPPPHTRSYSGHKLVQDKPVSAPAE